MPVRVVTGNHAVAWATKYARVRVIAAYPITPQTTIVERIAEMIESGEFDAEIVRVESEHSALAATLGAAAAGVRAFTATSSHGLLYMHEVLWWASGSRIPVVMAVAMRAIGPPWNIHVDHNDIMDQRDCGWIIAIAESNQEVFDLIIQAYRISEDPDVYLPVMVGLDGFILTHTTEPVDMPEQEKVDEWLPPRTQPYVMDPEHRHVMGNVMPDEEFMELRKSIQTSMEKAKRVIREVDESYGKQFGRRYGGLVECYRCNGMKYAMVTTGSWSGDAKEAVDALREEGLDFGLLRIRYIRPWPREEVLDLLGGLKGVVVVDRSISFGAYGHLFTEISATLYGRTSLQGFVTGLGGVDVRPEDFISMAKIFVKKLEEEGRVYEPLTWFGTR